MKSALVMMVRLYQLLLSPILPFNHCRFVPSCSEYAIEAIEKHGIVRGTFLAVRRVLRCYPFQKRGFYDPVP